MDPRLTRRVAPAVYGIAILLCALFARSLLVPVCVVGAVLLGLMYTMLPRYERRPGDRVRNRRSARNR